MWRCVVVVFWFLVGAVWAAPPEGALVLEGSTGPAYRNVIWAEGCRIVIEVDEQRGGQFALRSRFAFQLQHSTFQAQGRAAVSGFTVVRKFASSDFAALYIDLPEAFPAEFEMPIYRADGLYDRVTERRGDQPFVERPSVAIAYFLVGAEAEARAEALFVRLSQMRDGQCRMIG